MRLCVMLPAGGRRLGGLLLAAALAVAGCAGALDESAADNVETGLAQLRQLSFTQKVPFVIRSTDQAQRMMLDKMMRDNTDDELRIAGETGVMTGLFAPGINLKAEELRLMRQQVAGFYDPRDKVMVEVRGQSVLGNALAGRPVFSTELLRAHELTHALQDQHFGLDQMLSAVRHNDDQEIAIHSLIEGDATLAGIAYVAGGMTGQEEQTIAAHFAAMPDSFEPEASGTPLALSVPLMFQYTQGTRFVAAAWERGGWAAVDALYHDPPRSALQIMNPALYFDHRVTLARITVGGYARALPDWKKVDEDTFGALLVKIIFERSQRPGEPAQKLAEAWRGDRLIALEKDGALTLIWLLGFQDEAAAQAFAGAYRAVLARLKGPLRRHRVEVRERAALVMIGPPALDFASLAPSVWRASTIAPP